MRCQCMTQFSWLPGQLAAILLLLGIGARIHGQLLGSASIGGASGEGLEWWTENITNATNSTELCSGMMDLNSSTLIFSEPSLANFSCSENYTYDRCGVRDVITLSTDDVSYIDGESTIVASVEPNATRSHDKLYYKLCYSMDGSSGESEVIECVSNGTVMVSQYRWRESGEAVLTVHVYTSSSFNDSDFLDCSMKKVTVASDYGLNLTVKLFNEPFLLTEDTTTPLHPIEEDAKEEEDPLFILGNITFAATANLSSGIKQDVDYYYSFLVSGPAWEDGVSSRQPNWTREFLQLGHYQYSIHAIAKLDRIEAHHANVTGGFELLEGVGEVVMQVGSNNSVKVGSTQELTVTAEGSTPISVCWYKKRVKAKKSSDIDPYEGTTTTPSPALSNVEGNRSAIPLQDCIVLNDSNSTIFKEYKTFNVVGTFVYVAHFCNGASQVKRNFTFHVFSGPSPSLVASGATALVILAVLVALVVVVVALVAGGYVPYRRYKNRMTETADFRFVDLGEENSTPWNRFKRKAKQFMDYFRGKRLNEKIGLVNLGAVPMTEERRLFYGTNTLTQFAPYETL